MALCKQHGAAINTPPPSSPPPPPPPPHPTSRAQTSAVHLSVFLRPPSFLSFPTSPTPSPPSLCRCLSLSLSPLSLSLLSLSLSLSLSLPLSLSLSIYLSSLSCPLGSLRFLVLPPTQSPPLPRLSCLSLPRLQEPADEDSGPEAPEPLPGPRTDQGGSSSSSNDGGPGQPLLEISGASEV